MRICVRRRSSLRGSDRCLVPERVVLRLRLRCGHDPGRGQRRSGRTKPLSVQGSDHRATSESLRAWSSHARKIESLELSVLPVADHYLNTTVCAPRLAAAAAVTTTLRVGSYVYNNDFRHPALLAREAAEIDVLSDGRMELGTARVGLRTSTTPSRSPSNPDRSAPNAATRGSGDSRPPPARGRRSGVPPGTPLSPQ